MGMERRSALYSGILHAGLITAAMAGLPDLWASDPVEDQPILVELMELAEKTASPPPKPLPAPEPPKPAPARPVAEAAKPVPAPPNAPPPGPTPPEERIAALPPPEAKPVPVEPAPPTPEAAKPEAARPAPVPAQKPSPPRETAAERTPAPPDNFASVLKTVEALRRQAPVPAETRASQAERTAPRAPLSLDQRLTISDFDSIRRQFEACWSPPAGAKDAKNLAVLIKVKMNADGMVQTAEFAETQRFGSDPFYRAAAESAMRAVLNRRCQPIKAPPEKYAGANGWNALVINFDPKELIGP